MKKGAKVWCFIAILVIIGSAFVGVVSAEEIIIDTEKGESRFMEYPSRPVIGWYYIFDHDTFHTKAYNDNFWYTLCGEKGHGDPFFGVWQASLPQSGDYEVFVWIPDPDPFVEEWSPDRTYTPTQSAVYQIYHKAGMTTKTVNQELRTGGFYSLGTFNFDTRASVILNDRTDESYLSTMIAFDAVKFVPVVAPNTPPYTPSNPSPANHATDQSIHTDLGWIGGDPDTGDTVTYDVYFGTSTRPLKVSTAQSKTTYDPGTLSYSTYYWRIVATDNHGAPTTGPLWDFTTGSAPNQPPNTPTMLFQLKSDGVTLIPVGSETTENSVTFKGVVSDPDGDQVKLQVELRRLDEYGGQFDETQGGFKESGFLESGSKAIVYANGLIDADYHWRARAVDEHGNEGEWEDFGNDDILDADFIVSSQNQPPVAFFTGSPQSPKVGEEALLNASNSYDPDGREIKFYEWDLDGDDSYNGFTTSPEIYYYWSAGGTYSVRLRVTDNVGATGTFVKEVIVQQNTWWEKIKKFFAPKVETLSGSEKRRFEMIKSELHISNYPHSENPSSDSDFYGISDDQLLTVLKKVIKPEASDLTYETYIIDTLHDMKLADSVAKRPFSQNPIVVEYFENMAEINGWAVAGEIINEALIEAVIIEAGGGIGIGPILMLPDICQAGLGLRLLADTRYRLALWYYFDQRGAGESSEVAFGLSPVPNDYKVETTRELFEKLWIEYGGSHISDSGGLKRDFQEQVINELRAVLLYGIEKYKFEPCQLYHIKSPGEVRVYDSQGRVTGSINGELSEEIPNSAYDDESKKLLVFNATDSYFCQVVGTDTGTYGLDVTSIEDGEATTFTATDIPTTPGAIHQYTIDWAALSQGEKGVTVKIDSDGNDVVERTIITNNSFCPLIAEFTVSPENPLIGEKVTLDASSSFDLGGGVIKKYRWEFYNAANQYPFYVIEGHDKKNIRYSFTSEGIYLVRLTVTDDEGEYSYTESSITIKEPIKAPVFYVPDDYPSIQAAVDAASAGDTIIVRDGTYTENVDIDKSITLKSSSGNPEYTIVDAVDSYADVFSVTADHVNISGFTVTGAPDFYGIYLYNADYCDISDNICSHNAASGIYLSGSNSNSISNNTCINNGMGGICLSSSTKNSIANNTCSNNGFAGIDLGCSNQNSISNNLCCNNKLGIFLDATNNNRIYLNNFINNDCNAYSCSSTNTWYSPLKESYSYNGESHTNYLGNYWSDYTGTDANKNGIGDSPYSIDDRGGDIDQDYYPLMTWSEHYFPSPTIPTPPTSTLTPTPRPRLTPPTSTLTPTPRPTLTPSPTLTPTPRPTLRPTATLFEKIEGLTAAIRVCWCWYLG